MRWSALSRPQSALSRPLIVDHIVQLIEIVIPFGIILNGIYTNRYKTLGKWYLTTNPSIDLNAITCTIVLQQGLFYLSPILGFNISLYEVLYKQKRYKKN